MKPFDFVVLGAGAAGCAAARSLARSFPDATVALVEQGAPHKKSTLPSCMTVPLLQPFIPYSRAASRYLRTYSGLEEEGLGKRRPEYVRGSGLGGTSLLNNMRYLRGTEADFAAWNHPEWTYEKVVPTFKGLERNSRRGSEAHGGAGPLTVTDSHVANAQSDLNNLWFEACEAAGIVQTNDLNDGRADGFTPYQSLIERGRRVDVFSSLIQEDMHLTPNLTLFTETRVEKLVWDKNGSRATAAVIADREASRIFGGHFVVCLGAIESPALLLRSGLNDGDVGSDAESSENASAAASSTGIGKNLIEGVTVDLVFRLGNPGNVHTKSFSFSTAQYMYRQWQELKEEGTGVFASLSEACAHVRSKDTIEEPNLSLTMSTFPMLANQRVSLFRGYTASITLHHPKSRGEVFLDSESGKVQVRSNTLSQREDVEALDEGIQWAGLLCGPESPLRSVYRQSVSGNHTAPFNHLKPLLVQPSHGIRTQRETAAFLAEFGHGSGELFGTCAMGSVVDGKLLVRGTDNVRVADSSVVPTATVGTSATVGAMIGSRVASFVNA